MTLPDLKYAHHLIERVESTRLVFRVFDDRSYRNYNPETGFVARINQPLDLLDAAAIESSVEKTLRFSNREATPWISTSRRWLWALWEANRRANDNLIIRQNVQIAVIDLGACWAVNRRTPIEGLGYARSPFIHALSGLSGAEERLKRFANASDEILIYHQVPACAVIAIWRFDTDNVSSLPIQFSRPLPPPDGEPQGFASIRREVARQFATQKRHGTWDAGEAGTLCATVTFVILQDAYTRLVDDVDEIVNWARTTGTTGEPLRSRPSGTFGATSRNSLPRSPTGGSRNLNSYYFAEDDVLLIVYYIMNNLVELTDPLYREAIEPIVSRTIQNLACEVDRSLKQFYEGFLAHKQLFMDRVMSIISANALVIRARHAHFKLSKFRAFALEMARTVPLGLMDGLRITQSDWLTMKRHIFQMVSIRLAPVANKLHPLANAPWPGNKFGDEARIQLGVEEAKGREWMKKEVNYPFWWEECGMQQSRIDHKPRARIY